MTAYIRYTYETLSDGSRVYDVMASNGDLTVTLYRARDEQEAKRVESLILAACNPHNPIHNRILCAT